MTPLYCVRVDTYATREGRPTATCGERSGLMTPEMAAGDTSFASEGSPQNGLVIRASAFVLKQDHGDRAHPGPRSSKTRSR